MPGYIMKVPWYLEKGDASLDHHKSRFVNQTASIDEWYPRAEVQKNLVYKYRKGACENCGAMTHTKKECMDRPRKTGAQYSGQNFKSDEVVKDLV